MQKLYICLTRRDKKGAKLLTVLQGETKGVRLPDIGVLNLPPAVERELNDLIYKNRMYWEVWGESAESCGDLCKKLKTRGYSNIDIRHPIYDKTDLRNLITADYKKIQQVKTMIRKVV